MLPNHSSMRAAIMSLFLYKKKTTFFLIKTLSKYTLQRINCNMFSKIIRVVNTPYQACSYNKYFLYNNASFRIIFTTKSDQNIHQNPINCTIFNNFLGDQASNTPTKRMKKNIPTPPPPPPPAPAKSWLRPWGINVKIDLCSIITYHKSYDICVSTV